MLERNSGNSVVPKINAGLQTVKANFQFINEKIAKQLLFADIEEKLKKCKHASLVAIEVSFSYLMHDGSVASPAVAEYAFKVADGHPEKSLKPVE